MQIDFRKLGQTLSDAGLTGRAVNDYSKEEVATAAMAFLLSVYPDRGAVFQKPFIENDSLIIPFDSDPIYWWWRPCGQSVFETLRELKATEEVWKKYTDESNAPF